MKKVITFLLLGFLVQNAIVTPAELQIVDPLTEISSVEIARQAYDAFKQEYTRSLSQEYQNYRFNIFKQNLEKINAHNANSSKTYTQGVNQFTDKTQSEYTAYLMKGLGLSPPVQGKKMSAPTSFNMSNIAPIDYRKRLAVSQVRNQGFCGSCWAFSVISTIQSNVFIKKKGSFLRFSEQHFVDCCGAQGFGCNGCQGTWPGVALEFSAQKGNALIKDYPYVGVVQSCKTSVPLKKYLNPTTPYYQLRGVRDTLYYLIAGGPLSVTLDATEWGSYSSGIFNDCPTGSLNYNHAVNVVGIQSGGIWIIRNSWGPNWGENGHIRITSGNSCGITDWVLYPVVA